jgi:hypothetical protein
VLNRSDIAVGDMVAMGALGYVIDGMIIKDERLKWCARAPSNACCGVPR